MDHFSKFMKQTRIVADTDLICRWKSDAQYHGDKHIKIQMATARRTATSLEKIVKDFVNMKPEQELAAKAAASVMRAVANEMKELAAWAKAFQIFCEAERKKERAVALESIVQTRWGDDAEALNFEVELIRELILAGVSPALGRWMHSRGLYKQIEAENFSSPFSLTSIRALNDIKSIEVAACVLDAMSDTERYLSYDEKHVRCSWGDYEQYLAYRKSMASTTVQQ